MAKYTIRVELEGLHAGMQRLGFWRAVNGQRDGTPVTVQLPTGLYYGESALGTSDVAATVNKVASAIQKVVGVFVAKTETWSSQP
jgi:hypothetical protein